jgi:hypothetical protein
MEEEQAAYFPKDYQMKHLVFLQFSIAGCISLASCSHGPHWAKHSTTETGTALHKKQYEEMLQEDRLVASDLRRDYVTSLNELLNQAASEEKKGDCASAGLLYRQVLRDYPNDSVTEGRLRWKREEIAARLSSCSSTLMEKGLIAYRSGEINRAIKTWKMLVAFDPEFPGARKAIETASTQLKSLHSLEKKKK